VSISKQNTVRKGKAGNWVGINLHKKIVTALGYYDFRIFGIKGSPKLYNKKNFFTGIR
jgi:hypothetical protein